MQSREWPVGEISERLTKLESQNRHLRIVIFVALAAASVALFASLAATVAQRGLSLQQPGQSRPAAVLSADTLVARRITLTDRRGRTLAELATTQGNLEMPIMRFYGVEPLAEKGTLLRMTIGVMPDPQIVVCHAFGPSERGDDRLLSLNFLGNEPSLSLRSGRGNLSGLNPGGLTLHFTEDGIPQLILLNKGGKVWSMP